ncbi:Imm50 family immunity protein [Streptomyces sp. NPDC004539]|uniref:Imm50 family immunity protein n=1 Tax=Streptomyces sp. NPDC004539 TaxID=3154280 RepID=UPI0033A76272
MTVDEFVANSDVLGPLYGDVLPLAGDLRLRSVNLNWIGPTVTLRVDLASFPEFAPQEWREAGLDTVQCQLRFLDVGRLDMEGWRPPVVARVGVVSRLERRRIRVEVRPVGREVGISFECSDSVTVGRVGAFKIQGDGMDGGPRVHLKRLENRLYQSLPGTCERTYYERF